jgi:hypothetical protein
MTRHEHERLAGYLQQLAAVTLETSRNLRLLPVFLGLLGRAPDTVAELMCTRAQTVKRVFVFRSSS